MISFNRVILTGKVVTPPRHSYRPDGSPVIQFPLELDETKDLSAWERSRRGNRPASNNKGLWMPPKHTSSGNLIHVVAVGKLAEFRLDLESGQHLLVIGRLNQRSWRTPEGKSRTRTEVIATDLRTIEGSETDTCSSTGEMD
jgi:single-stranded DNA-binding protein